MALSTTTVSAQHETGSIFIQPKAGLNLATFMDADTEDRIKPDFIGGVEIEGFLTNKFSLSAGLFYSRQGAKSRKIEFKDEKLSMKLEADYIKLPILLNCYYNEHLAFKTGVQLGVLIHDGLTIKYTSDDAKIKLSGSITELGYKFNTFDISIPLGISYEFYNVMFETRYNISLTKAIKNMESLNSVFQFTFGYKFKVK